MDNIKATVVDGKVRYSLELSPGVTIEASTLAELLRVLVEYGANNE
jgi:hypothetical protein